MILLVQLFFLFLSYLMGAVPYGFILTRYYTGINILEHGSGNIGSTNVRRIAGARLAFFVQVLDMLKGFVPVMIFTFAETEYSSIFPDYYILLVAFCTILGHNFSIFLNFKGGKGVNTTLGSTILIAPVEVMIAVLIYLIVKLLFNYVSLGSIFLALTLPLSAFLRDGFSNTFIYLTCCTILIIACHHQNIRRIFKKAEFR